MSYVEKIEGIGVNLRNYLDGLTPEVYDAFATYVVDSGMEAKLQSEFGNKSFLEIAQSSDELPKILGDVFKDFSSEFIHTIFNIDVSSAIKNNEDVYTEAPEDLIKDESFAKQAPEFYTLLKATQCTIPDAYDPANQHILLETLDCLRSPVSTRLDSEINQYHLEKLTTLIENNPEAPDYLDTICDEGNARECALIKDMIASIQSNSIVNDEL